MKRTKIALVLTIAALGLAGTVKAQEDPGLNYDEWKTVPYTDEFGDETGEFAEVRFFRGTFSNSAVSGGELIVKGVMDADSFALYLYERGSAPAARLTYSSGSGYFRVKRASGEIERHSIWASETGPLLSSGKKDKFRLLMTQGHEEELKVVIREDDFGSGSSVYNFTLYTR